MNTIDEDEDTHIYGLDLYKTIFQNWCIMESLNSMTPDTSNLSVAPSNADTFSEASRPPKYTSFKGSQSNLNGENVLLSKKDSECESKTSHFTEIKCNLIGRIFLWENKCFAIFTKIIEINM